MSGIARDLIKHWYVDLSIPVVAAVIGYLTKLLAIRMIFRPIEFVGIRPCVGWQRIVARDSVFDLKEMVVTNLVTDKALLNRIFQ